MGSRETRNGSSSFSIGVEAWLQYIGPKGSMQFSHQGSWHSTRKLCCAYCEAMAFAKALFVGWRLLNG